MNIKYLDKNIIGADETGVGDYLTPLVCAAVFVPRSNVQKLLNAGITDSKKLTDKRILELFETIKPMIKSSVRYLTQKQYNALNKVYNAHELKSLIHLQAINAVEERTENVDMVIIDQFASPENIHKYFDRLYKEKDVVPIKGELILVEKGEMEHVSVAAASVVARAYFIKMMDEQNKKWDFIFPLGTNDIVENAAKDFVKKYGMSNLNEVAKLSFKTTKKLFG